MSVERLTDKRMKGDGFIPVDPKEYKAFIKNEKPTGKQIYERLLEIEDILGDDYDLDHLRELVEADRDGRCVVLPCNVGDTVWMITRRGGNKRIERWTVSQVYKRDGGSWWFRLENQMLSQVRPNEMDVCTRAISSFEKTFFLTRKAAEAALKGEQE